MKIRADKILKARDRALEVLNSLTDADLREFERRSEFDATGDGFGDGNSGGRSSDVSRPTERVALATLEPRHYSDPQMVAIEIIRNETLAMRVSAIRIERAKSVIQHITDGRRGREVTLGTCNACERTDVANTGSDRIKAGYCPACWTAWCRQGRPDRLAFEISRRNYGDSE